MEGHTYTHIYIDVLYLNVYLLIYIYEERNTQSEKYIRPKTARRDDGRAKRPKVTVYCDRDGVIGVGGGIKKIVCRRIKI